MIIIDTKNRRDYYDCIKRTDQEKLPIYLRNEIKVKLKEWPFPTFQSPSSFYDSKLIIVGFCGKLYPLVKLTHEFGFTRETDSGFCNDVNDILSFVDRVFSKKEKDYFNHCNYARNGNNYSGGAYLIKFFDDCQKLIESNLKHLFKTINTDNINSSKVICDTHPIFICHYNNFKWRQEANYEITYNPMLYPLNFAKVINPHQAWQEINMFLNNIATPIKDPWTISDEEMAQSKGFNKFSFRKPKSE